MEKVITAIKVQKRNSERVNIDLDGEFAFGLSRITAAWLKIGDVLSEERIASLLQDDAMEVAYQRALLLLGYRSRSEQEMRRKLAEKDFTADQIDQVVEKLKHANLIKDEAFARAWVENRNESHPRSRRLMGYELKQKGITEEHIEKALTVSAGDVELARRAAASYSRRLAGSDRDTFRKRLSGHLARRGFSYDVIFPVVAEFWQQQDSIENITSNEEV